MVEKIFNITIKEKKKNNKTGSCVLASYLFNQCDPNSEIAKGFSIREIQYCLHMWIKFNNKIYDIANTRITKMFDVNNLQSPSIQKKNSIR